MLNANKRQAAIEWLKSDKRDFTEGLGILVESGFKPGVARRIQMLGENEETKMHLLENIRQFVSMFGAQAEDTDADLGVFDGKGPEEVLSEGDGEGDGEDGEEKKTIEELAKDVEDGKLEVGENTAEMIKKYADAYRKREQLHRSLSDIPEDNAPENIERRKAIVEEIAQLTDVMETVYPSIKEYLQTKEDISAEAAAKVNENIEELANKEAKDPTPDGDGTTGTEDLDSLSKEELQKRIKSVKTKILRKNNLLLYQKETKADVENPMPECPKRTKYETEIANLEKELEALQYALARKG